MAVATRGGKDAIWRKDETERVHLPHRPRLGLHRERRSRSCAVSSGSAVDGPGRIVSPQRCRRGVLLLPGVGGPHTPRRRQHRPGPGDRAGLVLWVPQPRPPAQRRPDDEPDQLREHRRTNPGSRIGKPSTFRGNHKPIGQKARENPYHQYTAIEDCTRLRAPRLPAQRPDTTIAFIDHILSKTPRPNGKVERSHRIDSEEFYRLLEGEVIDDARLFETRLQEWEDYYNYDRPHGALDGQTPYERLRQKAADPLS
jgi:hypothetical protein